MDGTSGTAHPTELMNACPHLFAHGCVMTGTNGTCCSCTDQRPIAESGLYSVYIDGSGFIENAPRWAYYCPGCRESNKDIQPQYIPSTVSGTIVGVMPRRCQQIKEQLPSQEDQEQDALSWIA
ncbi:hypothetical protein BX600DRAFT_473266 [Xylariales sp. PMI_506]|nr:hypothetical protein BX600DRAFT_473266 [Xylariales sp. PMI_506]